MHALVPAILVGAGGLDELGPHPQAQPPDAELREPAQGAGSEGLAIARMIISDCDGTLVDDEVEAAAK